MKISKILFSIITSTLFIVLSCDDEETVELFEPQLIDANSTSLVYEKLTAYPLLGSIQSANPTRGKAANPRPLEQNQTIPRTPYPTRWPAPPGSIGPIGRRVRWALAPRRPGATASARPCIRAPYSLPR